MPEKTDFNSIIEEEPLSNVFEYLDTYYEDMESHKSICESGVKISLFEYFGLINYTL